MNPRRASTLSFSVLSCAQAFGAMEHDASKPHEVNSHDVESTVTLTVVQEWLKGRYILERELGRGGFGVTYLAADTSLSSRRVVIKVLLHHRSSDAWSLKKFKTEVDALARIDHPGIVTVMDCGELPDGRPFIVMQYVNGTPLRQLIPKSGMPLARFADILLQTGRAISAAHEAGVLHRDLKPENIMLQTRTGGEESVRVIDFGLAAVIDSDIPLTSTKVAGTWQYMAPEQFEGKSFPATDVYQLGVVAYELATGIVPFRSESPPALLSEKMKSVKVPPRDLRPELPEAAQFAILRALSPNPLHRQSTPRELGEELSRAVLGHVHLPVQSDVLPGVKSRREGVSRTAFRRWLAAALLAGGAILVICLLLWTSRPARTKNRIAVLPFYNRAGDPDTAYIADGITEALINDLSHIPALNVRARGTVLPYENSNADPLAAGRALSVDRLVHGSVRKIGNEFQISVELMDIASGSHVWGDTYKTTASSLSKAVANVSAGITDQLRVNLSSSYKERRARKYAVDSKAYTYYLKGRFHLNNKRTADDLNRAVENFETAISADSSYAPAYAALAYAYTVIAFNGSSFAGSANATQLYALKDAKAAANRALELDATLAEAYTSLAMVHMQLDYDWDDAERTFRRAIDLDPNWADTRESYGLELAALGRTDDGLREVSMAETLEPGNPAFKVAKAFVLYNARRYDESLGVLKAALPNKPDAEAFGDMFAENYWAKSMNDRALSAVLSIPAALTDRVALVAAAYARVGEGGKARKLLMPYLSSQRVGPWYEVALAHISLDDKMSAVKDLERACNRRSSEVLFLGVDPMLDPLRSESGFRKLLIETKLTTNPNYK
jgi:eukaryotic-like serine/threonine-protein kinase